MPGLQFGRDFSLKGLVQSFLDGSSSHPRGPRVPVEQICERFYDQELLSPTDAESHRERFFASLEDSITRGDRAFDPLVDKDLFRCEITALRFELFGLAVNHSIGWQNEAGCLRELVATERYLRGHDEERIWHSMALYNQRLADAGFQLVHDRGQRSRRLSLRLGLAERWQKEGVPDGCLVRFANRCDCAPAWSSGMALTALLQLLGEQIRYPLNGRSQLQFMTLIQLFLKETMQRLGDVQVV